MLTLGIKLKKPHLVHILESFCPINCKQEFCQEDFTKFAAFMLESSMHQLVNLKKSFSNILLPYPTSSNSTKKESERIIWINFKPLSCSNVKGLCTAFSTKKKLEKNLIFGPFWVLFGSTSSKQNFLPPLQKVKSTLLHVAVKNQKNSTRPFFIKSEKPGQNFFKISSLIIF